MPNWCEGYLKITCEDKAELKRLINTVASKESVIDADKIIPYPDKFKLMDKVAEEVNKKVMSMYTDPDRIHSTDPGKIEGNPVFVYHDVFNPNKVEVEDLKKRYQEGKVGDIEVKEKLFVALNNFLTPIREKRKEFEGKDKILDQILRDGTQKAREVAGEIMKKVRKAMKIDYFK